MQKKTKRLLATAIPVAAAFTAFLTQYPSAKTRPEETLNYSLTLADIPLLAKANPRLSDLMWLGSHDCFSDQIRYCSAMDPAEKKNKQPYAHPLVRPITRGIAARYSKAQNIGAAAQLRAGARLLDIRLTWFKGTYYTRHSIISGEFEPYLREILRFLGNPAHAGEIVMLYVQHTFFADGKDYAQLFRWLSDIREEGKNLFDYIPYETAEVGAQTHKKLIDLRCNEVTNGGKQAGVVLLMRETELKSDFGYNKFYPIRDNIVAPWANRIADKDMQTFYLQQEQEAKHYTQSGEKDKLYVMQAQKTLRMNNLREFGWMVKGFSLLDLARDSNGKLVTKGILDCWFTGDFQILLLDNINTQKENFNTIINRKIRAFNEAIVRDLSL